MNVPKWDDFYPNILTATKEQKEFYVYFERNINSNIKVDINNTLAYIFVYLYQVVADFINNKDIEQLLIKFKRIETFYGNNEKIAIYVASWIKDAYLYVFDYENAWIYLKKCKFAEIQDVIYIRGNCSNTSIEAKDILQILKSNSGLTKFGIENFEKIEQLMNIFFNDFYFENKVNYVQYFLKKFNYSNLTNEDMLELEKFYTKLSDFEMWKKHYKDKQISNNPYPQVYHNHIFTGAPFYTPYFEREAIPYIILVAFENRLKSIVRECENTVRSEQNLPLVGEGWISETELYYKIFTNYPNEKVVHHGNPIWLKRQHLDIYFPNRNIGIEYQGIQHMKPVNYFGGQEGFEKVQRLDKQKSKLCKENGCHLIYVYENYNFKDIVNEIDSVLKSKK